jgi:hypothetical protein
MPGQVFISHSTKDHEPVSYVRDLIEAQGLRAYLAEHDPQPGRHLSDKVRANIESADAVIVLLTEMSIDSRFVHQEIGAARMANRLIVPLVHPKLLGENLAVLNGSEFLVFDPADLAASTPDLVAELRRLSQPEHAQPDVLQQALVAALVLGLLIVAFQLARAD